MTIVVPLAAGRRAAEALMTDTVLIRRPTGRTVQDEDTGREAEEFEDLFTSRCKVQYRNLVSLAEEAGGRTATSIRVELHMPLSAPGVRVGDRAEVTAVGDLSDAELLGHVYRVTGPMSKSFATARRHEVEEVVS